MADGVTGTFQANATVDGLTFNASTTVLSDNVQKSSKAVAGAKTGSLTTRTDNDTGTLTMTAGHGITTGAKVSIFWDDTGTGGAQKGARYGVTVGTVATNSVPIDLGGGDNLPAATTAVTVKVGEEEDLVLTGDNAQSIAVYAGAQGVIEFLEAANALAFAKSLPAAGGWSWFLGNGVTNPLAGKSVVKVRFTHASTSAKSMRASVQH